LSWFLVSDLINDKVFSICKRGVKVINVARGGIIEEAAIKRAIAISTATRFCASTVLAPKCGVAKTCGIWTRLKSFGGSLSNTSKPAPPH
jgi:hypothetical protein